AYLENLEREYVAASKGKEFVIKSIPKISYATTREVLKKTVSGVLTVIGKEGFGSGFIISSDGYIVTNYHVIEGEKNIMVKLNADLKLKATVAKTNEDFDLALLKVDAEDLKALRFGDSNDAEAGDDVYAIGTPLETSLGQTVTKGIISGFREFN